MAADEALGCLECVCVCVMEWMGVDLSRLNELRSWHHGRGDFLMACRLCGV